MQIARLSLNELGISIHEMRPGEKNLFRHLFYARACADFQREMEIREFVGGTGEVRGRCVGV